MGVVALEKKAGIIVVVPTYNSAETIGGLLSAIEGLETGAGGLGVVFVDGGSSDGTLEKIEEWRRRVTGRRKIAFVETIIVRKRGVSLARNLGLREALSRGAEIVVMLDSDVIPPSNIAVTASEHFSRDKRVCIVAAPVLTARPSFFELLNASRWPYPYGYVEVAPPGAWVMRRECIEDIGFFNERLGYPYSDWEQAEYSARARRRKWRLIVDWRIKSLHVKKASDPAGGGSPTGIIRFSINRYIRFLPHIWHELVKARPLYYTGITVSHLALLVSILGTPFYPLLLLYPSMTYLYYFSRTVGSPVPWKPKLLGPLGLMYMRSLISIGYLLWLLRRKREPGPG